MSRNRCGCRETFPQLIPGRIFHGPGCHREGTDTADGRATQRNAAPQELPAVNSARPAGEPGRVLPPQEIPQRGGKPGPRSSLIRDSAQQPAGAAPDDDLCMEWERGLRFAPCSPQCSECRGGSWAFAAKPSTLPVIDEPKVKAILLAWNELSEDLDSTFQPEETKRRMLRVANAIDALMDSIRGTMP